MNRTGPAPNHPLSGQVVILTGASSGVGLAVAKKLAQYGVWLALAARSESALQQLGQELLAAYPQAKVFCCPTDVRKAMAVENLVTKTLATFGRLDAVVNNAGVCPPSGLLQEHTLEDIDATIDTNLKGPMYLMKYALPHLAAQQSGTIINVNSVCGKTAFPYWSVYDASKFGLGALSQAVAEEQRSNKVRVMSLYLGAVDTPIWDGLGVAESSSQREKMLTPETVAEWMAEILSQPSSVFVPEVSLLPMEGIL